MRRELQRALFGGAIFCAGLVSGADAQSFTFPSLDYGSYDSAQLLVVDGYGLQNGNFFVSDYGSPYLTTPLGTLNLTLSNYPYDVGEHTGIASITSGAFGCSAEGYGTGDIASLANGVVTVPSRTDLRVDWDVAGDATVLAKIRLGRTDGTIIASVFETSGSGSMMIDVDPGVEYHISVSAEADEDADAEVSVSPVDVPCFADMNDDGAVNLDDLDQFVIRFLQSNIAEADCDGSGVLNLDDLQCFVDSFLSGCL